MIFRPLACIDLYPETDLLILRIITIMVEAAIPVSLFAVRAIVCIRVLS